jgi:hypothetical protein
MFVGDTLNIVLADGGPELTDGHLCTDAGWPLSISRTA